MWLNKNTPLVIAHRGDKVHAPENTLAAFEKAAENCADAVEFDVKLSADGCEIIIHDQTVDRTTNGSGRVKDLTLAELRKLDAGVQFPDKYSGEKIPTLSEVFDTVGRKLFLNIELTNYATPWDDLVEKVVKEVQNHKMQDRVFFSSFFPFNLRKAQKLLPQVPRGLLTWGGWMGWGGRNFGNLNKSYQAMNIFHSDVNPNMVERMHAKGKLVMVWTVNSEQDIKKMIEMKVDGIITDDPSLAVQILGKNN